MQRARAEEGRAKRGRLRIFLGMAPGVGTIEPVGVATQLLPPDALESEAEAELEADPESVPAEGDDAA